MITSVSVLCYVVDSRTFDLNTACREVSLEVCAVVLSIPETPFSDREDREALSFLAFICENYLLNFAVIVLRNEESNFSLESVLFTLDDGVAHTVAALILIQLCLYRGPAGVPYSTVIVDIEVTSAHIKRHVVIAVTCDTSETCILVEAVTACCVGDE